jgi:hypothetical protein
MAIPKRFDGTLYFYYMTRSDFMIVLPHTTPDLHALLLGSVDLQVEFDQSAMTDQTLAMLQHQLDEERRRHETAERELQALIVSTKHPDTPPGDE